LLERATWQDTNIRGNQDTAANFFKPQGYKSADYIPLLIETLHDHRKEIARLTIVKGKNGDLSGNFFKSQGYKPADYEGYMNGLDFTQPVFTETINRGKTLWQFQVPGGRQGMRYSPTPDVVPGQLGINPLGQIYKTETIVPKIVNVYQSTEKVTLLRSTSAPVLDTWSVSSQPYNAIGGARRMTSGQRELFKLITPGAL
jgi:hypothetical protein